MCVFGGPSFGRICPDSGTNFPDFFLYGTKCLFWGCHLWIVTKREEQQSTFWESEIDLLSTLSLSIFEKLLNYSADFGNLSSRGCYCYPANLRSMVDSRTSPSSPAASWTLQPDFVVFFLDVCVDFAGLAVFFPDVLGLCWVGRFRRLLGLCWVGRLRRLLPGRPRGLRWVGLRRLLPGLPCLGRLRRLLPVGFAALAFVVFFMVLFVDFAVLAFVVFYLDLFVDFAALAFVVFYLDCATFAAFVVFFLDSSRTLLGWPSSSSSWTSSWTSLRWPSSSSTWTRRLRCLLPGPRALIWV